MTKRPRETKRQAERRMPTREVTDIIDGNAQAETGAAMTENRCPLCGGRLEIAEATTFLAIAETFHVVGRPVPTRERETMVAACTECELCIDLLCGDGTPKTTERLDFEMAGWLTSEAVTVNVDSRRN